MKKEIIKPFDLEKAKAGAKLRTKSGLPVEIFKWDTRGKFPIKGMTKGKDYDDSISWTCNGSCCGNGVSSNYDLVIVEEVEEPKFHKGEWLCENEPNNYARFIQVLEVVDVQGKERYRIFRDYCNGEDTSECRFIEKYYHSFNIKDVKAGDILTWDDSKCIAIFKNFYDEGSFNSYGFIGACTGEFELRQTYHDIKGVHPATKEQYNLLYQKMEESGYRWNAKKLKLKKIKPEFWSDDVEKILNGFYINSDADIRGVHTLHNISNNYNVFATEKQAKSAFAMARISQIMANDIKNFGGPITDEEWENTEKKFAICRGGNYICRMLTIHDYYFLTFHTEKQRDLFLEKYPQLVKDYLMIP